MTSQALSVFKHFLLGFWKSKFVLIVKHYYYATIKLPILRNFCVVVSGGSRIDTAWIIGLHKPISALWDLARQPKHPPYESVTTPWRVRESGERLYIRLPPGVSTYTWTVLILRMELWNNKHTVNVGLMLSQRSRRWPTINPTLGSISSLVVS